MGHKIVGQLVRRRGGTKILVAAAVCIVGLAIGLGGSAILAQIGIPQPEPVSTGTCATATLTLDGTKTSVSVPCLPGQGTMSEGQVAQWYNQKYGTDLPASVFYMDNYDCGPC